MARVPPGETSDLVFDRTLRSFGGAGLLVRDQAYGDESDLFLADVLLECGYELDVIEMGINRGRRMWREVWARMDGDERVRTNRVMADAVHVNGAVSFMVAIGAAEISVNVLTQGAMGNRYAGDWSPSVFLTRRRSAGATMDMIDVRVDMPLPVLAGWRRTEAHHGYWRP